MHAADRQPDDPPDVVIVIPSLNRHEGLNETYCYWLNQTYRSHLIVVNQTRGYHLLPRATANVLVPWMRGASNARNLGMDVARCLPGVKYIGFWDDDDKPENDYVEAMRQVLVDGADIAACHVMHLGRVLPLAHKNGHNRMIRADKIGDKRWPGVERADGRFWDQFDHLKTRGVERVLYTTGNEPTGGIRDATGSK